MGVPVSTQNCCAIFAGGRTHGLVPGAKCQRSSVGIGQDNQVDGPRDGLGLEVCATVQRVGYASAASASPELAGPLEA